MLFSCWIFLKYLNLLSIGALYVPSWDLFPLFKKNDRQLIPKNTLLIPTFSCGCNFKKIKKIILTLTEHFWDTQYKFNLDLIYNKKNLLTNRTWNIFLDIVIFFLYFRDPITISFKGIQLCACEKRFFQQKTINLKYIINV